MEVLLISTDTCWIPVIPTDSGTIPVEFISQNFTPATGLWYSSTYTGTIPGMDQNGMASKCMARMDAKNCLIWQVLLFSYEKCILKNQKKIGMVLTIGDDVWHWLHGLWTFLNMVIDKNIARNLGKIRKKKNRHDVDYYRQCCGP